VGASTGAPTALPRQRDDVASLVDAARAGDQAAWGAIVDRYAPLVSSICRRFRLSRADTDDVGQTVWLRLLEHLGTMRDTSRLPGWLATTTRHECLRVMGAGYGRVRPDGLLFDVEEPELAVDRKVVERDHVAWALRVLEELPARQRTILMLLYQDWPVREIAHKLGMSSSTVRTHAFRAREKMRERARN
jgi:RNA polymerase sigma factor (sigma-70 family)